MERLELVVVAADVELVSGLLWAGGVAGIEEREEIGGHIRLIAGVEPDDVASVLAMLQDRWDVECSPMDADQWVDSWRPYATAVRISDDLVIQPPWVEAIGVAGDTVISLDPGRAWGHGAHPSTVLAAQLMLAAGSDEPAGRGGPVNEASLDARAVLDIGCGGGALAVIAAVLGSTHVVAIDLDPHAIEATCANATLNGVAESVVCSTTPVEEITERFDVVVANIGLGTLVALAPEVTERVASGGLLILSGLLADQVADAIVAYAGFELLQRRELDGWGAVLLAQSSAGSTDPSA